MITKNELKYFVSLHQKKHRRQENKFLVEGEKIVKEGIISKYACEIVFTTNEFFSNNEELIKLIKQRQIKIEIIKNQEFKKLSDTKSPQGIAAVFVIKENKFNIRKFDNDNLIVYLDNISDPGNVGTILRSCDWFGIKNIFISKNSAEYLNPKVIRSSMGSIFHLNIYEDFGFEELSVLKQNGFKILCTDLNGKSIFSLIKPGKSLIVFSNESTGPSSDILNFADDKITIPGTGKAESLNVASAAAVILAQLTKK
ncbi:MAG: RNA methyltransferase [Ignavibacteriaceae bacterium]|nr:RNA methyltransferase [Ignavibacteriaceae bacterium]